MSVSRFQRVSAILDAHYPYRVHPRNIRRVLARAPTRGGKIKRRQKDDWAIAARIVEPYKLERPA